MTEPERRAAELRTLLAWVARQEEVVEGVGERVDRAASRAAGGDDPDLIAATALFLQHYYTAVEDALLKIAEELDGSGPRGDEWHRSLLEQMSLDVPESRPALLDGPLRHHLDALRRFRHRVRHAYDDVYDWSRMREPLDAQAQAAELLPAFFSRVEIVVREIIRALDAAG